MGEEEEEIFNPRKRLRGEEPKKSDNVELDNISEDGLDQSIIDVLENESISEDDSEDSENEEQDEIIPAESGLSHCDLCQLSLPIASFISHMELHKNEITRHSDDELEDTTEDPSDSGNIDSILDKEVNSDNFVGDKLDSSAVSNSEFSKCEVCDKELKRKNMSRHKRRLHGIYSSGQNILEKVDAVERSDVPAANFASLEDVSTEEASYEDDKHDSSQLMGSSVPVRCEICVKPMQKKSLARHMANIHPTEKSRANLFSPASRRHEDTAMGSDSYINNSVKEEQEFDYRCKICFTRFQLLEDVKNHVKEDHDIDYEDLETIDDKEMKVSREGAMRKLKTELILQESEQEGTTLDESCDESDVSTGSDGKLQCDMCDFQFVRKDSLLRHNRNAHRKVST